MKNSGQATTTDRASQHNLMPQDVKAIRYRMGQTQPEFASMLGVSVTTLQGWEEGRHHPDGPARALLQVAAKNPKIVAKTLGRA
jgi:putative transcriptional regulator